MVGQSPSGAGSWIGKPGIAIAELGARIAVTIEGWRQRRRLLHELVKLQRQGELARTLTDSGIAPGDLPRLLQFHPRTPQQLADMMRRLGIARAAFARDSGRMEALRAMEWRCGECSNWRQCRTWLDSPAATTTYRAFCPNAEALDEIRSAAAAESGQAKRRGILAELERASGE